MRVGFCEWEATFVNERQILWMRDNFCNFCEWGIDFVNEGQILWMRVAGICAVCQSVGRCVCWQAGIPPRTKHCTCTWQCIFARWRGASLHLAVHLCTVGRSNAVANSRVHSYRFVHSLAWETLLTFSETRLVFQTLSASLIFVPKTFFRKCPSQRIYAKYIRNSGHVYPHILKLSFSGSQIETLQACLTGWIKIWW